MVSPNKMVREREGGGRAGAGPVGGVGWMSCRLLVHTHVYIHIHMHIYIHTRITHIQK